MQYFGRAIGSVSKTWNSINPSTLSGAIDVVVVRRPNGDLYSSAFHIRFGKFALLRPTQKAVDFYVNGEKVPIPMKLGDGGEAVFVFATESDVPASMETSPVLSPAGSPRGESPASSDEEVDYLDINQTEEDKEDAEEDESALLTSEWIKHNDRERLDELISKLSSIQMPSTKNDKGEVILDMTGYKPGGQNTKELESVVKGIWSQDVTNAVDSSLKLAENDSEGSPSASPASSPPVSPSGSPPQSPGTAMRKPIRRRHYVQTLRLTSDILKSLNLKPGKNDIKFRVRDSKASVSAAIYFWEYSTPVVISDIDGTITRSDALGHVMTMIGRDWTHEGVSKLYTDIVKNGYNMLYLTARAVGQADTTRSYLESVYQDGCHLPSGPVILSPDRTMAALHREVIMRKPEIFKMACLRDISKLYDLEEGTPFYAGFGNRITDALSYRSVDIPSTKIFTIDTNSEVHMELLELSGYKSSYVHIRDLVDHFFPIAAKNGEHQALTEFNDANFWKIPVDSLSDDTDSVMSASYDFRSRLRVTFGDNSSAMPNNETVTSSAGSSYGSDAFSETDGESYKSEDEGNYSDVGSEDGNAVQDTPQMDAHPVAAGPISVT